MVVCSRDGLSCANVFSFTIHNSGTSFIIIDNLTKVEYARYDTSWEANKALIELQEAILASKRVFDFPK